MSKRRPFGVTVLALLAYFAGVMAVYHTLQMLHLLPITGPFGVFQFFTFDFLGAIIWGVLAAVYFWVGTKLWTLDAQGWLFVVLVAALNLIMAVISILGRSTWEAMLPSIIVNGLILIYSQLPGTKEAFRIEPVTAAAATPAAPAPPAAKMEAAPAAPAAAAVAAAEVVAEESPPAPAEEEAPAVEPEAVAVVEMAAEAAEEPEAAPAEEPPFEPEAEPAEEPPDPARGVTGAAALTSDLSYVEGIGEVYAGKLKEAGVDTPQALLDSGATPRGRKDLAEATGISEHLILKWVDAVDLYRIKGLGTQYAELLKAAGVDTVPELAQRNPENLYAKLIEVNEERRHVRHAPSQSQVADWVRQAKELPRVVSY